MEDSKARQLFEQILQKTKAGRITWSPTADEFTYLTILPGGIALSISKTTEESRDWGDPVEKMAMILRAKDVELLRVVPGDAISKVDFAELYESARQKALGVDATVEKLIGDLARM